MFSSQKAFRAKERGKNIDLALLAYWGILVFWQNINPGGTGTMADTLIKTGLIVFLVGYYLLTAGTFTRRSVLLTLLFGGTTLMSFLMESTFSLRMILTYFFPVALAFCSLCAGGSFRITKRQLLRFMYIVIFIVLYMAIYALIATPRKFISALTTTNAYGNELTSFLISNLEYGLYLLAGIVACIVCIELDNEKNFFKKILFAVSIPMFFVNLILTYSRTSIIITLVVLVMYVIMNRRSKFGKTLLLLMLVGLVLIFAIPILRQYFFEIVFKGNNLAGRDELASLAIETFKQGSILEKLWGQGASATAQFFRDEAGHSSVHNAYLQILLYFGIFGLVALLLLLLSQLRVAILLVKKHRFLGVLYVGITLSAAIVMLTTTSMLFSSPIDSFFLTMFTIIVPRYVRNAILTNSFEN